MGRFLHPAEVRNRSKSVWLLTETGMMAAFITIMTAYICHIPVGVNGGYIHLGDGLIFLTGTLLPFPYGIAAAVIGAGLADLLTAPAWVGATVIIKGLIVLCFTQKGRKILTKRNIGAVFAAYVISAVGYYIADGILFGFHAAFLVSVAQSTVQWAGSTVFFLMAGLCLDRMEFKKRIGGIGR